MWFFLTYYSSYIDELSSTFFFLSSTTMYKIMVKRWCIYGLYDQDELGGTFMYSRWGEDLKLKEGREVSWRDCFFSTPAVKCRLAWRLRWSLRLKHLSQWLHLKGFCPVCLRVCLVSSSLLANFQVQPSHLQMYGFSPVCVRLCAFKWDDLV